MELLACFAPRRNCFVVVVRILLHVTTVIAVVRGIVPVATLSGLAEGHHIQAVLRDITESDRREAQMRSYVQEITRAQEKERRRIARKLHDDTAQSLIRLCRALDDIGSHEAESARELAETILVDVRRFSRDLRPSILDDLGLREAGIGGVRT